jgi:hypothetical protein
MTCVEFQPGGGGAEARNRRRPRPAREVPIKRLPASTDLMSISAKGSIPLGVTDIPGLEVSARSSPWATVPRLARG